MLPDEVISAAFGAIAAILLVPLLEALALGPPNRGTAAIFLRAVWGAGAGLLWQRMRPR
jgi:hypothetical protein